MKTISLDSIELKGGSSYIPQEKDDAYRVVSGSVYVYIVPWSHGEPGRRSLLCCVDKGSMIPAFVYRDLDHQSWRFSIVAVDEAQLERMEGFNTGPLRKKFLSKAGVDNPGNEGYEDALVNRYRMNLVQEDGYLIRTGKDKEKVQADTSDLIASFFAKKKTAKKEDGNAAVYQVVAELCHHSKIKIAPYERIAACCDKEITFHDIARISHFPCRDIILEEKWHEADAGSILVYFGEDREPAACIPKGRGGYYLYRSGQEPVKLTEQLAEQCDPKACMIYRPFPQTEMTAKDFAKYCVGGLSKGDIAAILVLTIVSSLIGLLLPTLNQMMYDQFIPMGQKSMIIQIGCLIASFMIGNLAFSVVQSLASFRLSSKIRYDVQNAVYHRIFELPENFFRKYESADLANRIMELGSLACEVGEMVLSLGLSVVVSVFYLVRMFSYSPILSVVSLLMTLLFSLLIYFMARYQMRYQERIMKLNGKSDSIMFQFLMGIEKIRIAGIEERVIYEYMKSFVEQRKAEADLGKVSYVSSAISSVSSSIFTIVLYTVAYQWSGISMGQFVGFNSAFGMVSSTINGLVGALVNYKMLKPAYDRVRDILETAPEANEAKQLPGDVSGQIDLDHVAFAYDEGLPPIFTDLSLHIDAGEYIGIVGSSGCGKSTLLKLLLGFEKPTSGKIYFDNQDMDDLDLQELRKKFGVVLQNGELISGSIFDNITLTSPNSNFREVDEVVEAVGLTEDINDMPMGLQTVVSEQCGTISGGQKQRILIARAIINHPKVLFFDEATSALDNITQAQVCETLEKMGGTRLVIAHRLSTIKNCDRILVMDRGAIVEEGNYDTLMEQRGLFYELASRQLM